MSVAVPLFVFRNHPSVVSPPPATSSVITSYSIHYTKLYEGSEAAERQRERVLGLITAIGELDAKLSELREELAEGKFAKEEKKKVEKECAGLHTEIVV